MSLGRVPARLAFPLAERIGGRGIRAKLVRLREEASAAPARRRRRQAERLEAICRHAAARVPFHRERFRRHGFDPAGLSESPERLAELPPMDRDDLLAAGDALLDERADRARLHERRTGGSTGPAAIVRYADEDLDWTAAVNLFARERAGKALFASEAHLSTAPGVAIPWRDRARERLKCISLNRTNLPISGWDPETLDRLQRRLARARPRLVQGHPSTLHALACHLREGGGPARPLFDLFESTGETLDPGARKTIEDVLGCRVVDRYGSAEFGVVAYERPGAERPGMEILDAVVVAETLPDGEGHEELVLTGLLNRTMPLLRYRTGDLVRLAHERGEVAGRIVEIHGRVHDAVVLAGRRTPTHVIQDRLDRLGCVEEFQIEVGEAAPRLRVAAPAAEHDRVRAAVREWWGDAFALEFAGRERFVRTGWRGKLRHLVERPGGERA